MSSSTSPAVLPGVPIVVAPPSEAVHQAGPATAAASASTAARADWPNLDSGFVECLVRRAAAEIDATTPPAPDPDKSIVDRWALEAVEALARRGEAAHARVRDAEAAVLKASRDLADLPKPWGLLKNLLVVLGLIALCLGASAGVGALMTGAVQLVFLKNVLAQAFGQAPDLIFFASLGVAAGMAFTLLGLQLGATIVAWGTLGRTKWLFVLMDVAFSVAFTVLRGGHALLPSIAAGLFEGSLLGVASIALAVVDTKLRKEAERSLPYKVGRAVLKAEKEELVAAERAHERVRTELAAQVDVLAKRESLVRTLSVRRALAEETARATVATETAALIAKASDDAATRTLTDLLTGDISTGHADVRETFDDRRYK